MAYEPKILEFYSKNGKSLTLEAAQAATGDADAILAMQQKVVDALEDRSIFVELSEAELLDSLENDFCLAIRSGNIICAMTVLVRNRISDRHVGTYLAYEDAQFLESVTYDSSFVIPEYRGYGIQKFLFAERDIAARQMGAKYALATVAPTNEFSLRNALESGFEIVDRRFMYAGVDRYVLRKELSR